MQTARAGTDRPDAERFGLGVGAILGGLVGGRLCKLLGRIAIARLLGAASLGLFDLGWTIAYLLAVITPFGMQTAVVRFGSTLWRRDPGSFAKLLRKALTASTSTGLAAGLVVFLLAEPLATRVFGLPELAWILRVLALMIPLASGLEVLAAATRATQRMRYTAYCRDLLEPGGQLLLFLSLWSLGYGLRGAVWAAVGGFALALGAIGWVVWNLLRAAPEPRGEAPGLRELLGFSLPAALATAMGALMLWVDRLVVGYFRPAEDLGVYAAAAQLAILFSLLLSALTTTFMPIFVDLWDRAERDRLRELSRIATRWGLWLVAPVAVVFLISPRTTLEGLFGSEFGWGGSSLVVLSLGQLINVGTGPVGVILLSTGHERRWMRLSVAALALNVVLDILLLPRYGIVGAAWGSAVGLALLMVGGLTSVFRLHRLWPYDRRLWKLVPAVLAAAGLVAAVRWAVTFGPLASLVLAATVSLTSVSAALWLLGPEPEDRELLLGLLRRSGIRVGRG